MGFFRSSQTPAPDLLHAFAQAHGLLPVEDTQVDDYLPRSCQVVDAHQLHSRSNDYGYVYYAFEGMLPGGIQGGISNGENIIMRVAFKPTATIRKEQKTVTASGEETVLAAKGRHDPCVLPRAVPMVEAMVALVLCDHLLRQQGQCGVLD